MELRTTEIDGKTYALVQDGKPVYFEKDREGREIDTPFDAVHTRGTIVRLQGEAKDNREKREAAEKRLSDFEGIDDPEKARQALATVGNLTAGDLVKADKVEEIKAAAKRAAEENVVAATKGFSEKIETLERERAELQTKLFNARVGDSFGNSQYIRDKLAVPADMVQAMFGGRFKIDDQDRVVGYGADNQPIYSRTRMGELANFDEALESMIEGYPYKNDVLKGTGSSGSGSGGTKMNGSGAKTMSRSEFDRLPPPRRQEVVRSGVSVVDG